MEVLDTSGPPYRGIGKLQKSVELLHTYLLIHDDIMDQCVNRGSKRSARLGPGARYGEVRSLLNEELRVVIKRAILGHETAPGLQMAHARGVPSLKKISAEVGPMSA